MADIAKVLAQDVAKLTKIVERLSSREESIDGKLRKQIDRAKALREPRLLLKGLVKSYMDAVKKTDGLTSARPKTVKAVQTAEKDPSKKAVSAAIAELKKHVADLKGSDNKKTKKFAKSIDSIASQLKALI